MRRLVPAAALISVVALLAACEDFDIGGMMDRYREDFHYSYPLDAGGSLEMENANGSIEISGWDKNIVDIEGSKYASSESRMKEIQIDISHSPGSVRIKTVPPIDRHGNYGARFVIRVPRRCQLVSIGSSNGAIHVEDIEGPARLKTSNGGIRASSIEGMLDARTSNGSIEISGVTGDTTLHTSNGGIRAEVRKGSFEASTTNGPITARLTDPDTKPVHLESSNGHIDLTLNAPREVHAETSNSAIVVRLPDSIGATLRARTSNSSISSDFDVTPHGAISKHRLEGVIGAGGPLLDLGTSNGSIRILRL
ncbi:MAG TPA: DUF4097 family beta strand repeat-containing protein [Bryobacteraceae bacterium]|jgi:DUF4097 and DUF4098 domain-containing protein YvlB|nr:DUF4097 family beta strand repeat-containing protein [Bryobacteraceae bacterium]